MKESKVYQFNEYVLGYDKGYNDRSCLTIGKIQNENLYVMSSLYDGAADVISMMLDSLNEEIKRSKGKLEEINCLIHKTLNDREINGIGNLNLSKILELTGDNNGNKI